MDEVPVDAGAGAHAEIDRCPACGGVFLEFFDGEPAALSRGLAGAAPPASGRPTGDAVCPDCEETMVLRPYLDEGPVIPRCEGCLAVFLTPALREEMAAWRAAPDAPEEASWVTRLLGWLDRA